VSFPYLGRLIPEQTREFVATQEFGVGEALEKAKELCRRDGKAWSLDDFESGVSGVTMLTVFADDDGSAHHFLILTGGCSPSVNSTPADSRVARIRGPQSSPPFCHGGRPVRRMIAMLFRVSASKITSSTKIKF
jgi:hypothetical protein